MFRDLTSAAATPSVWSEISGAIDRSEFFILFASPESCESDWVKREIDHWFNQKRPDWDPRDHFLVVLTDGALKWEPGGAGISWKDTNALPKWLDHEWVSGEARSVDSLGLTEPNIIDLTWARGRKLRRKERYAFDDAAASIAAKVQNRPKEDIHGEELRQQRLRLGLVAGAAVALLLLLATLWQFDVNRRAITAQQRATLADALADAALDHTSSRNYLASIRLLADAQQYAQTPRVRAASLATCQPAVTLDHSIRLPLPGFYRSKIVGGHTLLVQSDDRGFWIAPDHTLREVHRVPSGMFPYIAASPDGEAVAIVGDEELRTYETTTGDVGLAHPIVGVETKWLHWSSKLGLLLAASSTGIARVTATGMDTIVSGTQPLESVSVSKGLDSLFVSWQGGVCELYETNSWQRLGTVQINDLFDASEKAEIDFIYHTVVKASDGGATVAIVPNYVTTSMGPPALLVSTKTMSRIPLQSPPGLPDGYGLTIDFVANNARVLFTYYDTIWLTDLSTGQEIYRTTTGQHIRRCATDETGSFLLLAMQDGTVEVRWIVDGSLLERFAAHVGAVYSMTRFEDVFVTTGYDQMMRVWRLGTPPVPFKPFDGLIGSVAAAAPDSLWFATIPTRANGIVFGPLGQSENSLSFYGGFDAPEQIASMGFLDATTLIAGTWKGQLAVVRRRNNRWREPEWRRPTLRTIKEISFRQSGDIVLQTDGMLYAVSPSTMAVKDSVATRHWLADWAWVETGKANTVPPSSLEEELGWSAQLVEPDLVRVVSGNIAAYWTPSNGDCEITRLRSGSSSGLISGDGGHVLSKRTCADGHCGLAVTDLTTLEVIEIPNPFAVVYLADRGYDFNIDLWEFDGGAYTLSNWGIVQLWGGNDLSSPDLSKQITGLEVQGLQVRLSAAASAR